MRVRIHESRQHYFASTVDLGNSFEIFLQPGIAQSVFHFPHGYDLPAETQDRAFFDDVELIEFRSSMRPPVGRRSYREQLADIDEEEWRLTMLTGLRG